MSDHALGDHAGGDQDPRAVRSRAALIEAARALFLEKGYAGTTMEEIAARAGLTKRTVYNHYTDKGALFAEIVEDVIVYAEGFAEALARDLPTDLEQDDLPDTLHDLGRRLALGILRPEVIALRRLLVTESRGFPKLVRDYFDRAPGRVIAALASWFEELTGAGLLRASDPARAAEQLAYLVVGEPLDRAILTGTPPAREHLLACAREGVETFLARYGPRPQAGEPRAGGPGRSDIADRGRAGRMGHGAAPAGISSQRGAAGGLC